MIGYEWAYVGAEVICVNDDPSSSILKVKKPDLHGLKIGGPYVIDWVGNHSVNGLPSCHVVGFREEFKLKGKEFMANSAYGLFRFRPVKKKTIEEDVSIFKKMLIEDLLGDME